VGLVEDTVRIDPEGKVVEPQLPGELDSFNLFAMLTEECRRERSRRIDLGDASAKLKITIPNAYAAKQPGRQGFGRK